MSDFVRVAFECGHRVEIGRSEYGDGSAWCNACGEFQVYERCLTCYSLDCQSKDGPTLSGRCSSEHVTMGETA